MALVIEDGSGLLNSDSYVTVTEARSFASKRGVTLPADDNALETLLTQAMDYLEALTYKGTMYKDTQSLKFPRENVYSKSRRKFYPTNVVPVNLKNAQIQLAIEAQELGDLTPTSGNQEIVKEKVDVIETEYAKRGTTSNLVKFEKVLAYLDEFLEQGSQRSTLSATSSGLINKRL